MQNPFGARAANYRSAQVCWWLITTQGTDKNPLTVEELLLRFGDGEDSPKRELTHDELMHRLTLMTHAVGGTVER